MVLDDKDLEQVIGGTSIPYHVKSGDTLEKLAQKFHCTVEEICSWNNISDPNKIAIDQKLIFKF